jgi:hypothetical protein
MPMTSSLTQTTLSFLSAHKFAAVSGWVSLIVIALLLVLLTEREVVRAVVRSLPASTRRVFDVAAIPLVVTFAVLAIERFRVIGG